VRHFAINAANVSISILVLQKQHSSKHKSRFFSSAQTHKSDQNHFTHKI